MVHYVIWMPEDEILEFEQYAKELGLTLEELFQYAVRQARLEAEARGEWPRKPKIQRGKAVDDGASRVKSRTRARRRRTRPGRSS